MQKQKLYDNERRHFRKDWLYECALQCYDDHVPPETQKLLTRPVLSAVEGVLRTLDPDPDGGYLKTEKVDGIAVETWVPCVTLPMQATALPPASLIAATVSSAGAASRSLTTTLAPRDASSSAYVRPRPEPAPVTIATCPSYRSSLSAFGEIARSEGVAGGLWRGRSAEVIREAMGGHRRHGWEPCLRRAPRYFCVRHATRERCARLMASAALAGASAAVQKMAQMALCSLVFGGGKTAQRHQSVGQKSSEAAVRDSFCTRSQLEQPWLRTDGANLHHSCC